MKATRFFRYLNRLNSVLLLIVSLVIIAAVGYLLTTVINFRKPKPKQVVQVDTTLAKKTTPKKRASLPHFPHFVLSRA